MGRPLELSIIVPTYNESENIPELIGRIEAALEGIPFEIIVVDDNSPDGTADIAERLNGKYGNIRVLRRPGKFGLGSAILFGFRNARSNLLAVMDADLQHPPELLPEMYSRVKEGYDLAVASRYIEGGGVEGWSLIRKIISLGAIALAHLMLPKTRDVRDPMSGFFIVRRDVVNDVGLSSKGFKVLLEILVKGRSNSVAEIPYVFKPRKRGRSKLSSREILRYVLLLIELRARLSTPSV